MFQKDFAFYLGGELEGGFTGFVAEENFFLILEIEEGLTQEQGRQFLAAVKKGATSVAIDSLADFESYINEKVRQHNLPAVFSMATGFIKDTILYLKTTGGGIIYLRRENKLTPIIEGTLSASGYIKSADMVIFTTSRFMEVVGAEAELKRFFDDKKPSEIIDEITPLLKSKDDKGIIALFVQFSEFPSETVGEPLFQSHEKPWDKLSSTIKMIYQKNTIYSQNMGKRKTLTLLAVFLIFVVLVWSVGLGYQRRKEAAVQKKIESAREQILQKLNQAQEAAFLNISKSESLISEAEDETAKLKKEIGDNRKEIGELENLIRQRENKIIKREEKSYEEFFDLTIDNKQAKGNRFYLDADSIAILDRSGGRIYFLSLSKKSLDKKVFSEIKNALLLTSYQGEVLFYRPDEGIYKINLEGKLKKAIEKDRDWGEIVDFWIYNGNIYLLDSGKSEIYKYLVAEGGYSAKTSYFKGAAFGLKNANSLAIDASVYVGFADHIFKFTAGSQDDFKTSFPAASVNLTKVFTTRDLEKVYAWDKTKGSIYILGKNGTYEREINSSILKQADDFVVYNNAAYILAGAKIYKISLD